MQDTYMIVVDFHGFAAYTFKLQAFSLKRPLESFNNLRNCKLQLNLITSYCSYRSIQVNSQHSALISWKHLVQISLSCAIDITNLDTYEVIVYIIACQILNINAFTEWPWMVILHRECFFHKSPALV